MHQPASLSAPELGRRRGHHRASPASALTAYQRSAVVIDTADPHCGLDWALLGRDRSGRVRPRPGRRKPPRRARCRPPADPRTPARRPARHLARSRTPTPDASTADRRFDRAVGPMQFLPVDMGGGGGRRRRRRAARRTGHRRRLSRLGGLPLRRRRRPVDRRPVSAMRCSATTTAARTPRGCWRSPRSSVPAALFATSDDTTLERRRPAAGRAAARASRSHRTMVDQPGPDRQPDPAPPRPSRTDGPDYRAVRRRRTRPRRPRRQTHRRTRPTPTHRRRPDRRHRPTPTEPPVLTDPLPPELADLTPDQVDADNAAWADVRRRPGGRLVGRPGHRGRPDAVPGRRARHHGERPPDPQLLTFVDWLALNEDPATE